MNEDTLLVLLLGIGTTVVVTQGSIFAGLRALYAPLFGCPLCIGTWIGMFFRYAQLRQNPGSPLSVSFDSVWCGADIVGFGALTGACTLGLRRVTDFLDSSAALLDAILDYGKPKD